MSRPSNPAALSFPFSQGFGPVLELFKTGSLTSGSRGNRSHQTQVLMWGRAEQGNTIPSSAGGFVQKSGFAGTILSMCVLRADPQLPAGGSGRVHRIVSFVAPRSFHSSCLPSVGVQQAWQEPWWPKAVPAESWGLENAGDSGAGSGLGWPARCPRWVGHGFQTETQSAWLQRSVQLFRVGITVHLLPSPGGCGGIRNVPFP